MPDMIEQQRLEGLYEKLRLKLLDLPKKNRMLNYSLDVRSQRYLQDSFTLGGMDLRIHLVPCKLTFCVLQSPVGFCPTAWATCLFGGVLVLATARDAAHALC
jgi:hypothetical protein